MNINIIDEIEETSKINLNWFYHSTYYARSKYSSILTEGIKCNKLLKKPSSGRYNGKYYISLSKITIPDNICFLFYTTDKPSFIITNIEPIKCEGISEYEKYIDTKNIRHIGNYDGEYQYYYFIDKNYIKGIVYNLFDSFKYNTFDFQKIKNLLDLIDLLEILNIDIPIYDYSRRNKTLVHEINKEKIKYYSKKL